MVKMVILRPFEIKMSRVKFTQFCRYSDYKCPLFSHLGGGGVQREQCPLFSSFFFIHELPLLLISSTIVNHITFRSVPSVPTGGWKVGPHLGCSNDHWWRLCNPVCLHQVEKNQHTVHHSPYISHRIDTNNYRHLPFIPVEFVRKFWYHMVDQAKNSHGKELPEKVREFIDYVQRNYVGERTYYYSQTGDAEYSAPRFPIE